ncbi:hypothetical protein DFJ74DRAFT_755670 [Hyaloraphidium curvatum]|nr:hypothetical protein DFJ74DRAFT_755670 [Hyaloraphidium curvatum]
MSSVELHFGYHISLRQLVENAFVFRRWRPAVEELRLAHRSRVANPFSALPVELLQMIEEALWEAIRDPLVDPHKYDDDPEFDWWRFSFEIMNEDFREAADLVREQLGVALVKRADAWIYDFEFSDFLAFLVVDRRDPVLVSTGRDKLQFVAASRRISFRDYKVKKKQIALLDRAVKVLRLDVYEEPEEDVPFFSFDKCPWTIDEDPEPGWILVLSCSD